MRKLFLTQEIATFGRVLECGFAKFKNVILSYHIVKWNL